MAKTIWRKVTKIGRMTLPNIIRTYRLYLQRQCTIVIKERQMNRFSPSTPNLYQRKWKHISFKDIYTYICVCVLSNLIYNSPTPETTDFCQWVNG